MKIILTAAAAAIALALPAAPALADGHEMAEPEMLEQTWYRVELIKFKPGNRKRIGEIIELYEQADKATGQDGPYVMHMDTGSWNMAVFFKLKHGIAEMGWKSTPENDAWEAAFQNIVGGEAKAQAIFGEWQSLIQMTESQIGHHHPDAKE